MYCREGKQFKKSLANRKLAKDSTARRLYANDQLQYSTSGLEMEGEFMSIDKKIDYLTAELIQELGTMEIEEIQEFRIEVMRELDTFKRPELVKVYINRVIDLVIQKKQEEERAAI